MTERRYVPHAVTGEPVPVLTPEEQEAQRREARENPAVYISQVKCWCGAAQNLKHKGFWIWSGDSVQVACSRGHASMVRFLPETVTT